VRNLGPHIEEEEIQTIASQIPGFLCTHYISKELSKEAFSGKKKPYCFIKFESPEACEAAQSTLLDMEPGLGGNGKEATLSVEMAKRSLQTPVEKSSKVAVAVEKVVVAVEKVVVVVDTVSVAVEKVGVEVDTPVEVEADVSVEAVSPGSTLGAGKRERGEVDDDGVEVACAKLRLTDESAREIVSDSSPVANTPGSGWLSQRGGVREEGERSITPASSPDVTQALVSGTAAKRERSESGREEEASLWPTLSEAAGKEVVDSRGRSGVGAWKAKRVGEKPSPVQSDEREEESSAESRVMGAKRGRGNSNQKLDELEGSGARRKGSPPCEGAKGSSCRGAKGSRGTEFEV